MLIELVHGSVSLPVFPVLKCSDTFWQSRYFCLRLYNNSLSPAMRRTEEGDEWQVVVVFQLTSGLQIRKCC